MCNDKPFVYATSVRYALRPQVRSLCNALLALNIKRFVRQGSVAGVIC